MSFDDKQFAFQRLGALYAERTQPIAFFVGAGLSVSAGMPDWVGLRDRLIDVGESKFSTFALEQRPKKLADLYAIKKIPSYWRQFSRLEELIGFATFREAIIEKFATSASLAVPTLYKAIWSLRTRGVISLNLDMFARRAFAQEHHDAALTLVLPHDVGQKAHILKNPKQHFLALLHGTYDDVSSWVLTESAVRKMLDEPGYLNFVNSIFTTHTVIFIGIGADDVAAGGIIHQLIAKGINPGNHFWITSRSDPETDDWAERNNVLAIRYPSDSGHEEPLNTAISFLRDFKSIDEPLPPVVTRSYGISDTIESPSDLEKLDPNEIRFKLNAYAARFIEPDGQTYDSSGYADFLKRYRFTLHKAWYVDVEPPHNRFFNYRILDRLGDGLFGTVYKAETQDGTLRAIKLLRNEVLNNDVMLQCFRRGAASMKILERSHVGGVVRFYEATELPPAIIMEFVEGGNLEEAKPADLLDGWAEPIAICRDVARIVRSGHLLPERVLHRDIRPANIMLRDLYTTEQRKVVVLDFDLSWHIGAVGNTIAPHAMQAMAYLSPEQRTPTKDSASRSATVDSFGLAMTLYYLLTGMVPSLGEHREHNWEHSVYNRLSPKGVREWTCVRRRVARLIASGTASAQSKRPDMGELEFELSRLHECVTNQNAIDSAELVAEQIAFNAFGEHYEWDDDRLIARWQVASGAEFVVRSINDDKVVQLTITDGAQGHEARKNIARYLMKACDQAKRVLRSNGWNIEIDQVDSYCARISAAVGVNADPAVHRRWANMISEIEGLLRFD